ncbi:hypothetical protein MLD52_10325 [Puniceicoccaceae bacterium K14]|nr:hypothetical protein [Puniceicoccaceae bacterium K14]
MDIRQLRVNTLMISAVSLPFSFGIAQELDLDEEPFELSPFEVTSDSDTGYRATSTLAGTRLNTKLSEVGAAISVYTSEFLADTDAKKLEEILTYTASTEAGGVNGNYSGGVSGENNDEVRSNPAGTIRVRAFADATRTRDYFSSDIPSDSYNFDAVTVSRGPNAILAGIGAPGGVVDVSLKKAAFADEYSFSFEVGKHGSNRSEFSVNRNIIDQKLAVRVDGLYEDATFRQDPASEIDKRLYAALNWVINDPLDDGFFGRTSLRANVEDGRIEGIPPTTLTPVMSTSSWFPDDVTTANPYWRINGALRNYYDQDGNQIARNIGDSSSVTGYLDPDYTLKDGFPIFRQWAIVFPDPTSSEASVGISDAGLSNLQGFQGTIAGGPTRGFFRGTGDFNRNIAGFTRTRLQNPEVFDFYDLLLTGSLDTREQEFTAYDVRFEQLFLGGNAGIELALNDQSFERFHNFPINGSDEVFIDTNEFLSVRSDEYPEGIPNPNFGRPMVKSFSAFKDVYRTSDYKSHQATAFVRHDFKDKMEGWLGSTLGEQTLTGLYFDTDRNFKNRNVTGVFTNEGELSVTDSLGATVGGFTSWATAIWYLGDSQLGNNSTDLRLQPIESGSPSQNDSYTLRVYDTGTDSFITGTTTPKKIFTTYLDQLESIESTAFVWQGRWLEEHLTTLVGWRKDESDTFTSVDPETLPNGDLDLSDFELVPASSQEKESWTYSVVGLAPFELPYDSKLRFSWNQSENFSPVGQRRNQYNEDVGSPTAKTEEYGITLEMFNDRLSFRINKFETRISNADVDGPINAYNYISSLISRMIAADDLDLVPADHGYDSSNFQRFDDVARAFFEILPERLQENIGPDKNFNPRFVEVAGNLTWENDNITNLASLSEIVTEGWEYELFWNPTPNWRLAFNASQTEAVKDDLAALELQFSNDIFANSQTMFGGALVGGSRNPEQADSDATWEDQYSREHVATNETQAALSGSPTPEIREWRYNILTNYSFTDGLLQGLSFGGAMRWMDEAAVGFPFITNSNGDQVADISNPYFDDAQTRVDLNFGYRKSLNLLNRDVDWSIRLQVDNVFGDDELYTIMANADGTPGTVRISPDNRVWSIRNTFEF